MRKGGREGEGGREGQTRFSQCQGHCRIAPTHGDADGAAAAGVALAGCLEAGTVDGAGGGADAARSAAARGMGVDGGHDQSAEAGSTSSCGIVRHYGTISINTSPINL